MEQMLFMRAEFWDGDSRCCALAGEELRQRLCHDSLDALTAVWDFGA